MDPMGHDIRLSGIDTLWPVVNQAHLDGAEAQEAQRQLLERYAGAARRYLLAATRDADAAEELFQEFALRFLRGRLRGADPARGRFRDYVKRVLFHLAIDSHNQARKRPAALSPNHPEPAAPEAAPARGQTFLNSWREELMARAWAALGDAGRKADGLYFTVLRCRADHPQLSSEEMAAKLGETLGRELTAASVRQTLHRARERFADLLLVEVAQTLVDPSSTEIEAELAELGVLEYCRAALQRLRQCGSA